MDETDITIIPGAAAGVFHAVSIQIRCVRLIMLIVVAKIRVVIKIMRDVREYRSDLLSSSIAEGGGRAINDSVLL